MNDINPFLRKLKYKISKPIALLYFMFSSFSFLFSQTYKTDVLVVGGSTSGTIAAIQSARLGVKTLLIEETPWLGGMITTAGVSAIDGNHEMPSGLWGEFRDSLRNRYGGAAALETGWISNTLFEPHVAASIFKNMSGKEKNLNVLTETPFTKVVKKGSIYIVTTGGTKPKKILAKLIVDATELGDVAAAMGAKYRIGTDDPSVFGEENYAVRQTNIIQDMTYVGVLKNYGDGADKTIPQPANYTREEFACACKVPFCKSDDPDRPAGVVECEKMLTYALLPNGYIILNWPGRSGNDFYANVIEADEATRKRAYDSAKQVTLRYIYYIQKELGYKHLGIADDLFPTKDGFPPIPYHRESRRIEGVVSMNVHHIAEPFKTNLYRTGIAVGDYPIDQHHAKNSGAPKQNFPRVPSFNIPLGALIPKNVAGLIVAEKSISVSNIVNGSTRLQPCVLTIGQAAGVLAAISIKEKKQPEQVSVRSVQAALLDAKGYLMPYCDVKPDNPHFKSVQRIGATGILRGVGEPYLWANRTWFYPDSLVNEIEFKNNRIDYYAQPFLKEDTKNDTFYIGELYNDEPINFILNKKISNIQLLPNDDIRFDDIKKKWATYGLTNFNFKRPITRLELAVWLDEGSSEWFLRGKIDMNGNFVKPKQKR
jgi:hypothetical protein